MYLTIEVAWDLPKSSGALLKVFLLFFERKEYQTDSSSTLTEQSLHRMGIVAYVYSFVGSANLFLFIFLHKISSVTPLDPL